MADSHAQTHTTAAPTGDAISGRRRPPSPAEQARRVAWGKKYGAIQKEIGRKVRGEA